MPEDLDVKLAHLEEREKSNTRRLDEHDKELTELKKTYSIMEQMNYRVGEVEKSVDKIDKKLDEKQEEKGKKWDKLIDYIFYFFVAGVLALLAYKLGFK